MSSGSATTSFPSSAQLRVGHVKNCIGLEGDMASSSRCMTFMERSSYSQAIELDQNFVNGVWLGNTWFDDRLFGSFVVFRPDNGSSGDFFGTGQYGWQTRWTCLPLYEDDGRHMLHLGISGGWRDGTNNLSAGTAAADTITLQARPELRDDDPAASPTSKTNANGVGGAGQYLPDANANRLVSTGSITCNDEWLLGLEVLYIRGPFSFQAEYGWNFLNNAQVTVAGGEAGHRLRLQRRLPASGLHAVGREPGLRQEVRHASRATTSATRGPMKRLPRPRYGRRSSAAAAARGNLPAATRTST